MNTNESWKECVGGPEPPRTQNTTNVKLTQGQQKDENKRLREQVQKLIGVTQSSLNWLKNMNEAAEALADKDNEVFVAFGNKLLSFINKNRPNGINFMQIDKAIAKAKEQ